MGLIDRVEGFPFPVVFAAHGLTLTAAFELSLACDLIIASGIGPLWPGRDRGRPDPSMGGPQRLAERAGSGRARQLVMTGGLFVRRPSNAGTWSTKSSRTRGIDTYARKLTKRLANGPTLATR